jgi:hypothetical protein
MVLEIDLDDLIRETEHDGVASAHPLLNVNYVHDSASLLLHVFRDLLIRLRLFRALKVTPKVLEQRYLFLEVLWIIRERIFKANVLPICTSTLHVVKMKAIRVKNNLGRVVEEDAGCLVAQEVPKPVLRRIVDPFFYPNLVLSGLLETGFAFGLYTIYRSFRVLKVAVRVWFVQLAPADHIISLHRRSLRLP